MNHLSSAPLRKALAALKRSLDAPDNEITRNSTVQCFEFSFELCWKLLARYFKVELNFDVASPKVAIKEAGQKGIIPSVETWIDYLKKRNLTTHTYNEDTSIEVCDAAKSFYQDALDLADKIDSLIKES